MKKLFFVIAFIQLCVLQLLAQESSVKILLNEEERFRFDSIRLEFINSGFHVMIGDSTGMNNYANSQTVENTFIGHKAGSINRLGGWNTFLGARAGENHVEGDDNLFLGAWAGRYDSSGNQNTYIGTAAGLYSKVGQSNTYVGWCAGVFDSSGRYNVFIGIETGRVNTSGRLNAFVGTNAGYRNTSGSENTFLGTSAGGFSTAGSNNTYLGRRAGRYNETGSGNVFLGYYAGANEMGSNKLYIANNDTVAPLIYGEFDKRIMKINANRIETGFNENIFIGDSAGAYFDWGAANVFLGFRAGMKHEGGSGNVYIGDSAAFSNKSGGANTYIGSWAGVYDSAGRSNVFVGCTAGPYNKSGQRNVFVGTTSGYYNSSGNDNVFIGTSAGANNSAGSCNTFIGRRSGWSNQTGDSSIFIGFRAGHQETASNKLYIANSGTTEPLIYGEFDKSLLRIHGTLDINNAFQFPTSDGIDGQVLQTDGSGMINWETAHGDFSNGGEAAGAARTLGNTDNYALGFKTDDVVRLHIDENGNVGIGTSSPSNNLEVATDNGIATITTTSYRDSDFGAGQFIGRAARGTMDEPDAVQAGDFLASFNGRGYGDTRFSDRPRGRLGIVAAENWTDSTQGAYIILATTPVGTDESAIERLRISSDGNVGIATATPSATLDISGATGYDQLRMQASYTPSGSSDPNGHTGDIAWDDTYIYIKTSTGWKRAALGTW